jgi:hypothetical protein
MDIRIARDSMPPAMSVSWLITFAVSSTAYLLAAVQVINLGIIYNSMNMSIVGIVVLSVLLLIVFKLALRAMEKKVEAFHNTAISVVGEAIRTNQHENITDKQVNQLLIYGHVRIDNNRETTILHFTRNADPKYHLISSETQSITGQHANVGGR